MKTKLLILIFSLCLSIMVNAQKSDTTYIVSFKDTINHPSSGYILQQLKVPNYSFLKNTPDIECDLFAIRSLKMNQYLPKDSINNQIHMFIGVNKKKKEKYLVVDTNNNHDFSDDKLHVLPIPEGSLTMDEKREMCIEIEIILDAQKNKVVHIGIDLFNQIYLVKPNSSPDEELLETIVFYRDYMVAKGQIEDISFEMEGSKSWDFWDGGLNDKSNFKISYDDEIGNKNVKYLKKGDTIHIQDRLLQLSKIEHPNIYLKPIGMLSDSSRIGSYVPSIYAKELEGHRDILINDIIKNKYVFINFWGSWCRPCIASIPQLKGLYEKIKDREDVIMLGVALEDMKDLGKLETIINEKEIEWINLWTPKGGANSPTAITNKLLIRGYPTNLIIDNTGKIVYRASLGQKTKKNAIDFLLNMIDK